MWHFPLGWEDFHINKPAGVTEQAEYAKAHALCLPNVTIPEAIQINATSSHLAIWPVNM